MSRLSGAEYTAGLASRADEQLEELGKNINLPAITNGHTFISFIYLLLFHFQNRTPVFNQKDVKN
jgi:hypothetical protein